jgi:hypothetical protein
MTGAVIMNKEHTITMDLHPKVAEALFTRKDDEGNYLIESYIRGAAHENWSRAPSNRCVGRWIYTTNPHTPWANDLSDELNGM